LDQLEENMRQSASAATQPEVHLRTDKDASYAVFAKVLASSRRLGLNRIAVVGSEQFVQ
jgi:biopolymer transport protein ExbD